mmetsp:Transcript_32893/g.82631  ORF Transcript_32893/g.82631 Transcript_32893/m.82631 type:complete len:334 (+) Transcript_32893:815-1816(+)
MVFVRVAHTRLGPVLVDEVHHHLPAVPCLLAFHVALEQVDGGSAHVTNADGRRVLQVDLLAPLHGHRPARLHKGKHAPIWQRHHLLAFHIVRDIPIAVHPSHIESRACARHVAPGHQRHTHARSVHVPHERAHKPHSQRLQPLRQCGRLQCNRQVAVPEKARVARVPPRGPRIRPRLLAHGRAARERVGEHTLGPTGTEVNAGDGEEGTEEGKQVGGIVGLHLRQAVRTVQGQAVHGPHGPHFAACHVSSRVGRGDDHKELHARDGFKEANDAIDGAGRVCGRRGGIRPGHLPALLFNNQHRARAILPHYLEGLCAFLQSPLWRCHGCVSVQV